MVMQTFAERGKCKVQTAEQKKGERIRVGKQKSLQVCVVWVLTLKKECIICGMNETKVSDGDS